LNSVSVIATTSEAWWVAIPYFFEKMRLPRRPPILLGGLLAMTWLTEYLPQIK